jgi:hypothetical protein
MSGMDSRRRPGRRAHCCGGQEQAIKAPTQPHRHCPSKAVKLIPSDSSVVAQSPNINDTTEISSVAFLILPSGTNVAFPSVK